MFAKPSCRVLAQRQFRLPRPTSLGSQGPPRRSCNVVVCSASKDEEPNKASESTRRLHGAMSRPLQVGAEHGEGFLSLRMTGEVTRMDVDSMNEKLKHRGTLRLRHALKPDEAFGMIFNFDGVVVDTRTLLAHAWQSLAAARELPLPSSPGALRQLVLLSSQPNVNCPERMVMDVLGWTRDVRAARELTWQLAEHYQQALAQAPGPSAGLIQWLNALTNFNVPCALVSRLDKATVRRALERCHLHDHFSVMITGEDEAETLSQRLLSASLQLHRPPNHCVVFEDSPEGITAAHNCTMRVVGVASQWHPAYALRSADLTVANLSGLTVYNMRRLFANVGNEFMDLKQQAVARRDGGQGGGGGHNPNARGRRVRNAMLDP